MRWRARSIGQEGPRGQCVKYRTLAEKYRTLVPTHRRALRYVVPWLAGLGAGWVHPPVTAALRETVERERQQARGELASTTADEINNVLQAMVLRLAALREHAGGEHAGGELAGGVDALTRMVADAAATVRRLQDRAGKSRCEAALARTAVPSGALARRRVLVVDDDPDVLEAAGLALERLGQQVDLAPSGVVAVARVRAGERYDLILCDLGMPELDGWQVAREIDELTPGTRLYLVSGCAREVAPEQAAQAGVSGMLAKPLSLDALRSLVATSPSPASAGEESAHASERWQQARAQGGVVPDPAAPQLEAHDPVPR